MSQAASRIEYYEKVDVPIEVRPLLEFKRQLQDEQYDLELRAKEKKSKPTDKARLAQINHLISDTNLRLELMGWRKKRDHHETDFHKLFFRLKDIITENVGTDRASFIEKEAQWRVDNNAYRPCSILRDEEHQILESRKKWQLERENFKDVMESIRTLKGYLSEKIRTESDYTKRIVYTEIFKML